MNSVFRPEVSFNHGTDCRHSVLTSLSILYLSDTYIRCHSIYEFTIEVFDRGIAVETWRRIISFQSNILNLKIKMVNTSIFQMHVKKLHKLINIKTTDS